MPIDPSIPLRVQPINLGQIATQALQIRAQQQASERQNRLLQLQEQKVQREQAEFDRKAKLRDVANFSEAVLGPLYEAKDPVAVQSALEDKIADLGSEKAGPFMEILDLHKQDPNQAFRVLSQMNKQAKLEKLIPASSQADIKDVANLRKEFITQSKDFIKVRDAFSKVKIAGEKPSAAGDLALIFNYMKMLDPGSTVREGEFATAQNAAGVDDRVINIYNRLLTGERLSEDQRKDFINTAGNVMEAQLGSHSKLEKEYDRLAKEQDIDPSLIVVDFKLGQKQKEPQKETQEETPQATQQPIIPQEESYEERKKRLLGL